MRNLFMPVLAATVVAIAAPAAAKPERVEIQIDHADLDLTKTADRAVLEKRIASAVDKACTYRSVAIPGGKAVDRECVAGATRQALAQLEQRRTNRVASAN